MMARSNSPRFAINFLQKIIFAFIFLFFLQGAALSAMVGKLTYGKRQWESLDGTMRRLIPGVDRASRDMIQIVDKDTSAFNDYMVGIRKIIHRQNSQPFFF